MNSVPEIRRERVFIPPEMTSKEIRGKIWSSIRKSMGCKEKRILRQELLQEAGDHRSREFRSINFLLHCKESVLEEFRLEQRSGQASKRI